MKRRPARQGWEWGLGSMHALRPAIASAICACMHSAPWQLQQRCRSIEGARTHTHTNLKRSPKLSIHCAPLVAGDPSIASASHTHRTTTVGYLLFSYALRVCKPLGSER